jgi:SAM-dependent methyltransferase
MARMEYNRNEADAFASTRHLGDEEASQWRAAVSRHLSLQPGTRLLDLGAGTGSWAKAFSTWFPGVEVIAVEPSPAMRERSVYRPISAGHASDIPVADESVDAVWISTAIHHVPDLNAAVCELGRVLRPAGLVLIRSAFAGRHEAITLFRYFPEAIRALDSYPSVVQVEAVFAAGGFSKVSLERVPQITATSLQEAATTLRREAHTPLQLITDREYETGLRRLHRAALAKTGPVIDALDLLVLSRDQF